MTRQVADDEAGDISGDVDARGVERDASPYNIFTDSEPILGLAKSLIYPVHGMILRMAVISTNHIQGLGLLRREACLLLLHRTNLTLPPSPLSYYKTRPTSKKPTASFKAHLKGQIPNSLPNLWTRKLKDQVKMTILKIT